jgi:hypothetical protein
MIYSGTCEDIGIAQQLLVDFFNEVDRVLKEVMLK